MTAASAPATSSTGCDYAQRRVVAVVGAGLAGLSTAVHLLESDADVQVLVLESENRIGGRVLPTADGREGGADCISFQRGALVDFASKLGVECASYRGSKLGQQAIYMDGQWVLAADWFTSPVNPHRDSEALGRVPPIGALEIMLRGYDLSPEKQQETLAGVAKQSLHDAMLSRGFHPSLAQFASCNMWVCEDAERMSMSSLLLRRKSGLPTGEFYYFAKTTSELLTAAEKRLGDRIRLGHSVDRISLSEGGTSKRFRLEGGENVRAIEVDAVVLAVPPAHLSRIEQPAFASADVQKALNAVKTSPIVKVFFRVLREFWTEDKLPTMMWLEPSKYDVQMIMPVYDAATRRTPTDGDVITGFVAIATGRGARNLCRVAKFEPERVGGIVQELLGRVRPASHRCLDWQDTHIWNDEEGSARSGVLHYYPPDEDEPQYWSCFEQAGSGGVCDGRVFAGEHTEAHACTKGYDSAVASGQRAAQQVLQFLHLKGSSDEGCSATA